MLKFYRKHSDKVSHFAACYAIAGISEAVLRLIFSLLGILISHEIIRAIALLMSFLTGITKEFLDKKTTGFDWLDLVADVMGLLTYHFCSPI